MLRFALLGVFIYGASPVLAQPQLANQRDFRTIGGEESGQVAFTTDSKQFYFVFPFHRMSIRDVRSGDVVRQIGEPVDAYPWDLALSPDGKSLALIAGGTTGGEVRLLDRESGDLLQILRGHQKIVRSVAFSADSQTVITCGDDRTLRWWDATSGENTATEPTGGTSFAFDMASGLVAVPTSPTGGSGVVEIWNVASRAEQRTVATAHTGYAIAIAPGGTLVATLAGPRANPVIQVHDTQSGVLVTTLEDAYQDGTDRLAFSPDGNLLAEAETNGGVVLWDAATGKRLSRERGGITGDLLFSPDGQWLAQVYGISDSSSGVMLWEVMQ